MEELLKRPEIDCLFFRGFSEILKFFSRGIHFALERSALFYHSYPSDEWKYLAFVTEAELYRRDMCSVINLKEQFVFLKRWLDTKNVGQTRFYL